MRNYKGFSLIELVVAMAIAAILAAVAIPAYSNYVRKAHRTDAKSALLDLASLEERYFSTQNAYTTTWSDLGYSAASSASAVTVGSGYYSVATPAASAATPPTATTTGQPATFTITATAIGDQVKDTSCYTFTVTSGGARSSANSGGTDTTPTCW